MSNIVPLLIATGAVAPRAFTPQVAFDGRSYILSIEANAPIAQAGTSVLKGHRDETWPPFSQWTFTRPPAAVGGEEKGFTVIVNEATRQILDLRLDLEAGGPFLLLASLDKRFVVLDYGTGTGVRNLEVRTESGKTAYKTAYFDAIEPKWEKDGLEFVTAVEVPLALNPETGKCKQVGSAWRTTWHRFDGKRATKLSRPGAIVCGN